MDRSFPFLNKVVLVEGSLGVNSKGTHFFLFMNLKRKYIGKQLVSWIKKPISVFLGSKMLIKNGQYAEAIKDR